MSTALFTLCTGCDLRDGSQVVNISLSAYPRDVLPTSKRRCSIVKQTYWNIVFALQSDICMIHLDETLQNPIYVQMYSKLSNHIKLDDCVLLSILSTGTFFYFGSAFARSIPASTLLHPLDTKCVVWNFSTGSAQWAIHSIHQDDTIADFDLTFDVPISFEGMFCRTVEWQSDDIQCLFCSKIYGGGLRPQNDL